MQCKFFHVPATDPGLAETDLNSFLRNTRVLDVTTEFVSDGGNSSWYVCVRYLESGGAKPGNAKARQKRERVDYKEVLDDATFAVFSKLRECRKAIAQDEGIPAFAVFTDEELAGIAKLENRTESSIQAVPGIGEKKAERFGGRMLAEYSVRSGDETSG